MAQEHIESLEQQLADAEKKVSDANQRGICFCNHAFMVALHRFNRLSDYIIRLGRSCVSELTKKHAFRFAGTG